MYGRFKKEILATNKNTTTFISYIIIIEIIINVFKHIMSVLF